jgi:hypothetical protein
MCKVKGDKAMSLATETIKKCAKMISQDKGLPMYNSLCRIENTLENMHGISEKFWKDRTGLDPHYLHLILGE